MSEAGGATTRANTPIYAEGESWKTGSHTKRERMEAYVEWLCTPKEVRDPKTKSELAELLGISPQTLRNYAKDPWLQREVIMRGRALNRVERAQDVLDTLYDQAVDRDNTRSVAAAKVWLDWVHTRIEPDALDTDITEMTDEELLELLHRMVDQLEDVSETK